MSFFSKCLELYYSLPIKVLNLMNKNKQGSITAFCKSYERNSNEYCLVDLLPKYDSNISVNKLNTDTMDSEFAIIIQGQIKNEFTTESVKIYKKLFPKAVLIISTWDNIEECYKIQLLKEGAVVLISHLPEKSGLSNVNYQIVSTLVGVRYAFEKGIPFVFKTRSDQRIYNSNSFEYLKSIIEVWPVSTKNRTNQRGRIITVSGFRNQMFTPYYLQDFLYFGYTEDLLKLFNIDTSLQLYP